MIRICNEGSTALVHWSLLLKKISSLYAVQLDVEKLNCSDETPYPWILIGSSLRNRALWLVRHILVMESTVVGRTGVCIVGSQSYHRDHVRNVSLYGNRKWYIVREKKRKTFNLMCEMNQSVTSNLPQIPHGYHPYVWGLVFRRFQENTPRDL